MTTSEQLNGGLPIEDKVVHDPFFGSTDDINMEMNWEQLDAWVESFQATLHESDPIAQDRDMVGSLNWW